MALKLGVQGSGQWVAGLPDPGFFRAVAETAECLSQVERLSEVGP